ncbi:MAG: hypothetical protein IKJ50_04510 [Clostridia bacterium]|nr:hypothetical protein [Clostridia bacterium]
MMKLNADELYNRLSYLFFEEQRRLECDVEEKLKRVTFNRSDVYALIEYVKAVERAEYFRCYMLDILRWISTLF